MMPSRVAQCAIKGLNGTLQAYLPLATARAPRAGRKDNGQPGQTVDDEIVPDSHAGFGRVHVHLEAVYKQR